MSNEKKWREMYRKRGEKEKEIEERKTEKVERKNYNCY